MKKNFYLVILLVLPIFSFAQVIILLTNPSFEDVGRHSQVPSGWYDCGFPGESPPDTQPDLQGTFGVSKNAYDGFTYLGLVVRDNNTWEAVSQQLPEKLETDSCYTLFIYAARSVSYVSASRTNGMEANYVTPVILRIYSGFDYCDKTKLLAESDLITNTAWKELKFDFQPDADYTRLVIEAFYKIPVLFPYNGNVLVDYLQLEKGCGDR